MAYSFTLMFYTIKRVNPSTFYLLCDAKRIVNSINTQGLFEYFTMKLKKTVLSYSEVNLFRKTGFGFFYA